MHKLIEDDGFFAKSFPVKTVDDKKIKYVELPYGIGEVSSTFQFSFENTGVMKEGVLYTVKTTPDHIGEQITLGDIMEDGDVDPQFFIPEERLFYTDPEINHSDETEHVLPKENRQTWQYLKGARKWR